MLLMKMLWLKEGDEIEMEIAGIGVLKNKVVKEESAWSILKNKLNREDAKTLRNE